VGSDTPSPVECSDTNGLIKGEDGAPKTVLPSIRTQDEKLVAFKIFNFDPKTKQ
jgi:hypothetical protein